MLLALRSRRFATVLVCLLTLTATQAAHASPGLTFRGLVRTLNTGGGIALSSPSDMVVDPAGNVYIADTGHGQIVEVNAQGAASVLTISGLSPALVSPTGIAIDGSGTLYVTDADPANSRVVKISSSGAGSVINTGSVTLSSPHGVALDQSGDILIADTGNNRIVEVTAGGSAAVLSITGLSSPSTLNTPTGLAMDVFGNLYIADSVNSRIVKMTAGGTAGAVVSIAGGVTLNTPSGVAVDRIGNIFIADTGNNLIAEVDTAGNGTVLFNPSMTLSGPLGVAVDVFGTVSIADTGDNQVLIVNPPVNAYITPADATYSLNKSAVGFGHVQLGASSTATLTLPFTIGSTALGSVKVLTSGEPSLDFTAGTNTTCNSATGAGALCSVEINFLPTAPGLRQGAVVLYDGSGNPMLTVPLYGFSDAPVAALAPNSGSVISTGTLATSNPYQIALDGAGNMYVGDYTGKNVTKILAGGGSASVVSLGTPGGTPTQNITGVAVDGAGNLFIGDHLNSRILVMTPGGVISVLTINGLSSLGFHTALTFDGAGNLYIADFTNGRIVEVSSLVVTGSTSSGKGTTISTGSYSFTGSTLTGLAVDSQGTIYAAARTQNNSSIVKITAAGVASLLPLTNGVTISNPQGVSVDAMGNVYIVDTGNSRIVKVTTAGATSTLSLSGLSNPSTLGSLLFGVTADSSGNLYIPDWTNNRIVFVNVSGSNLTFASTNVGSTSSDSPKTATVTNIGNQPLTFSAVPTFTADFSENGSDTNPCRASTILSAGTNCDVAIKFTPQSPGSPSANIAVADNALNVANSAQQIAVSGTAINPGDTTAATISINSSSAVYGQAVTIVAKVVDTQSGHTTTIPTGSVTFIDTFGSTVSQLNSVAIDASGNATLSGVVLNGLGTHTITASYAGVSNTFLISSNSASIVINQSPVTIAGPSAQPVSITAGQVGSIAVTLTGAYPAPNTPSGTISYSILNASNTSVLSGTAPLTAGSGSSAATVTIPATLAAGTYIASITYGGDANYQSSPAATAVSLHVGQITPTIAWNAPGSISYGANLAGLLTATASNGSTSIPGAFTYTATRSGGAASPIAATTVLGAGTYLLTAIFTPTDTTTYTTNSSAATLNVGKAPVATSLMSSINPSIVTGSVTFTATATSSISTPTGTVSFFDGTALLGTATLSQGQASYTTASFATGPHSITAAYSGDNNFTASISPAVVQLVQDFTLSTPTSGTGNAPSATVTPGGTATYSLLIGPSQGIVFPAPVTLSVSGLPPGATATLSPQTLPAGSSLSSVTLTIQVPQQAAERPRDLRLAAPALALLFLPFAGRMRRTGKTLQRLSLLLLLLIAGAGAMFGLTGCGAKDSGFFGQTEKTYNVLITATSGSLSHSTSVTLTVQ